MSEQEVGSQDQVNEPETPATQAEKSGMSAMKKAVIAALLLLGIVLFVQLNLGDEPDRPVTATSLSASESAAGRAAENVAPETTSANVVILNRDEDDMVKVGGIERRGEGRHFFTTIKVPAGAESLYLSGSGASPLENGSWGEMEQQVVDTFESFKETLESQGWSMSDIVQVRAFAVSDEFGYLDFDGFNRGYRKFFGTEENPLKPVRTFVEIQGLVVPGWLIEIEIRAARMPN
jgi:enamine deaminase RidA (YjgF/YER057c/UK114 family)